MISDEGLDEEARKDNMATPDKASMSVLEYSEGYITAKIEEFFIKFEQEHPNIDGLSLAGKYKLNIEMHKEFLDSFNREIQGDRELQAKGTNLSLTVFSQKLFAEKANGLLGFYFPQGVTQSYDRCVLEEQVPDTKGKKNIGRADKLLDNISQLFQSPVLQETIGEYKEKYGKDANNWSFQQRAELCDVIYKNFLDPIILDPMREELPKIELSKKTINPLETHTNAIIRANFVASTGVSLSRGFTLGQEYAESINETYKKHPEQVEIQLEEIANFFNRMDKVQIPLSKQQYKTDQITFGIMCDLSGYTHDLIDEQKKKVIGSFTSKQTNELENIFGKNTDEAIAALDLVRRLREGTMTAEDFTNQLKELPVPKDKQLDDRKISELVEGLKTGIASGTEVAELVKEIATKENTRLAGYFISREDLAAFKDATKEAKQIVGRDKDANKEIHYDQISPENRLSIRLKFQEVLRKFEASFDQNESLSEERRDQLKQEAREFIISQQNEYAGSIDIKTVAFKITKNIVKVKGEEIPVVSPKHLEKINELLSSSNANEFINRYSATSEEGNKFRESVNAILPKSNDIGKKLAKTTYLKNIIENPELCIKLCEKMAKGESQIIDTKFVKAFNKLYEEEKLVQPRQVIEEIVMNKVPPISSVTVEVIEIEPQKSATTLPPKQDSLPGEIEKEVEKLSKGIDSGMKDFKYKMLNELNQFIRSQGGVIDINSEEFKAFKRASFDANLEAAKSAQASVMALNAVEEDNLKLINKLKDKGASEESCEKLRVQVRSFRENLEGSLSSNEGVKEALSDFLKRKSLEAAIPFKLMQTEPEGFESHEGFKPHLRELLTNEKKEIADNLLAHITIPQQTRDNLLLTDQTLSMILTPIIKIRMKESLAKQNLDGVYQISKDEQGNLRLEDTEAFVKVVNADLAKYSDVDKLAAYAIALQSKQALKEKGVEVNAQYVDNLVTILSPLGYGNLAKNRVEIVNIYSNAASTSYSTTNELAAYGIVMESIQKLKDKGKEVSKEQVDKMVKNLTPAVSTLEIDYLAKNREKIVEELSNKLYDRRSMSARITNEFSISTENLQRISYGFVQIAEQNKSTARIAIQDVPKYIDSEGNSLLHIAAREGNNKLLNELINRGADLNIRDRNGKTPLHIAAEQGNERIINSLIKAGADQNIKDNLGHIASEVAATTRVRTTMKEATIISAVRKGEINTLLAASPIGQRLALRVATGDGKQQVVETLLSNIDFTREDRGEAFRIAARKGNGNMLKVLLASDISKEDRGEALCTAVKNNNPSVVKILLEDDKSRSPKQQISQHDKVEAYRFTKKAMNEEIINNLKGAIGKNYEQELSQGRELRYAVREADKNKDTGKLEALLKKKSFTSEDRGEALRMAASWGNNEIVKTLLTSDISKEDRGEALRTAAKYNDLEVAKTLLDNEKKMSPAQKISDHDKSEAYRLTKRGSPLEELLSHKQVHGQHTESVLKQEGAHTHSRGK